jgi:hypothetical protein
MVLSDCGLQFLKCAVRLIAGARPSLEWL